jgi:hypothetical protein
MENWPKDNETVSFWNLTGPVCFAIRQAYELVPKDYGKKIVWSGLTLPKNMKVTSLEFDERLIRKQLEYEEEDQGRDPLEVIVGIAVQLGIEQGRRLNEKDKVPIVDLMKIAISMLESK